MKTRNGFVSNSSSSSFVVVVPTAAVKEASKNNTKYEKEYFAYVSKNIKMLGRDITVITYTTGENDSWQYDFDFDKETLKPKEGVKYDWTWGLENQPTRCVLAEEFDSFVERLKKTAGKNYYRHKEEN